MKKYLIAGLLILVTLITGDTEGSQISLCFTGDILLDRGVREKTGQYGYDYPYQLVDDILKKADITFGNLECPLTDRGTPNPGDRNLKFCGDVRNTSYLKKAGYDILNLANNHSLDWGSEGLSDTVNALKSRGLHSLGADKNGDKVQNPVIIKRGRIKTGFLGYSYVFTENNVYKEGYGIFSMDEENLVEDIKKARRQCDFLVVSFHFGEEYDYYPNKEQKNIARLAVDCGADLVIGHHPHVLQGYEKYSGKYIFYSLGNFVFDRQFREGTDESVILNLILDKEGVKHIEMLPIRIKNCRPYLAEGGDRESILDRIKMYSERID